MCVLQLLCDGSKIATILNEFSQKLERKKNLSSLVYVLKQNFPSATAEKSDRKVYVMRQMQNNVLLVLNQKRIKLSNFWTYWNQSDGSDISFSAIIESALLKM